MSKETAKNKQATNNEPYDDNSNIPHYDPHITPAETAARLDREKGEFLRTPSKEDDENQEVGGGPADPDAIDTTGGYTVDKEGLLNNYAVEPEMYINEPGDLRQAEEEKAMERREEISGVNDDEEGKLTMDRDVRHRGQGIV